ncbi:putative 26S proteasome regulatory subunit, partial [Spiromyces aspiralis]
GFVEKDKVVRFGYVDQENHQRLKKLQELVQKTDGQEITVLVERVVEGDIQRVALKVRPRTGWGGNGKLG